MPSNSEFIVESPEPNFPVPEITLGRFFKNKIDAIVRDHPDKVAVIESESDRRLLFRDLDVEARRLGPVLLAKGLEAGDCVYFFGDNSIDYLVSMTAVHYLGICYAPSKPADGPFEVFHQSTRLKARAMVVAAAKLPVLHKAFNQPQWAAGLAGLKFILVIEETPDSRENVSKLKQLAQNIPVFSYKQLTSNASGEILEAIPYFDVNVHKDRCVVTHTSGTTGLPKGAVHTNYSLVAAFENFDRSAFLAENRQATMLSMFPFGHISGSIFTPAALMNGMTVVLAPKISEDPVVVMQIMSKYAIDILPLSQALSMAMSTTDYRPQFDLSSFKSIFFGGTKFSKHVIEAIVKIYNVKPYEMYGATEMLLAVGEVGTQCEELIFGSLGRPMPNVQMKIVDLSAPEKSLPAYKEGEICFRGPNCFLGYFENEDETKETIDADGWYHSGDVGYYDSTGRLFITDRIKELIKYKEWSVFPSEIEAFLLTHPDVIAVCVVGVPHKTEVSHLRAYVQRRDGARVEADELIEMVKQNMGYQKRLNAGLVFVQTMPRTIIGKVDRPHFKNLAKLELLTQLAEKA